MELSNYERALEWQRRQEIYRRRPFLVSRMEAQEVAMGRKAAVRGAVTIKLAEASMVGAVQLERRANAAIREERGAEFAIREIQAAANFGLIQNLIWYTDRP